MTPQNRPSARDLDLSTDLSTVPAAVHPSNHGHLPSTNAGMRVQNPHTRTRLTARKQSGYLLTQTDEKDDLGELRYRENRDAVREYFEEMREKKEREQSTKGCPGCVRGVCVDRACPAEHRAHWGAQ